jgi:uncharacterized protein (DUF433 family)
MTLDDIVEETRRLPADVVAELVDRILSAQHGGIAREIEAGWKKEIHTRMTEIKTGKVKGVPVEESLARARKIAGLWNTSYIQRRTKKLTEAVRYYTAVDPELGIRFYREIERLIADVCSAPERFRRFDPPVRRHFSSWFPYAVIYLFEESHVWIVAVMHMERLPGVLEKAAWRSRGVTWQKEMLVAEGRCWHSSGTVNYRKIITLELGKRSGQPCVRGMRITVSDVLGYLASGMSESDVLSDFPELASEDIRACLAFAADRERHTQVIKG